MSDSDPEPRRAFVPSCEEIRGLMLLDALGETSPEQKAALATHLQSDPGLAAEHADFTRLATALSMNTAVIPPLPAHLHLRLAGAVATPASRGPFLRRSLAMAATVVLSGVLLWFSGENARTPNHSDSAMPPAVDLPSRDSAAAQKALPDRQPSRFALLVGVENESSDTPQAAKTREFDVNRFSDLLTSTYHFPPEQILKVLNRDATLRGVVEAFQRHLIDQCIPGDVVVFLYTGHGTQVADLDGDEEDGLDEALCTFDFDWSKPETWFTDDLLGSLIVRLKTERVLVINTACHSGTSTRGEAEGSDLPMPDGFNSGFQSPRPATDGFEIVAKDSNGPVGHLLIAGCAADEVSWRSDETGSFLLTELIPILRGEGRKSSFENVIARIGPVLAQKAKDSCNLRNEPEKPQTPQLEGATKEVVMEYLTPRRPIPAEPGPGVTPGPPHAPTPPPTPLPIWQKQSGDISLALSTDKTIYTEGDLMQVTVTPDLDCHLRLYYLSAEHQVYQIFPNQFQADGFVKKGETVTLPGAAGTFEFRMSAPFGNEILMAVASSVPFTDQSDEDLKTALFQEFKDTNLEYLAHRGITVGEKKALTGRALHLYRVEARK